MKIKILVALMTVAIVSASRAQTPMNDQKRMEWWSDARFGMFIHWGLYAVPAGVYEGKDIPGIGEWIMNHGKIPVEVYKRYASQFNPTSFDAEKIVKLAKDAGMKYIVITAKHHDGFAMFKSNVSDFNIVDATPFKCDVIKEMATACKKYGVKFGLYYSQAQDWTHPGGAANGGHWDKKQDGSMDEYIDKIAVPQIKELLTGYGPISVIWFDTPTDMNRERAAKISEVLKLQPHLIINNRLGGGFSGDLETPEQYIPATGFPGRYWETCMTMNDTWGYKQKDKNFKATRILVQNIADVASKGGNYLLNIGPDALGQVPEESVSRLQDIGKWMKVNGEAIYGTSHGPFHYLGWGRCTQKGNILYLHVFNWPKDGKLSVPLNNELSDAWLLTNKNMKISWQKQGERLLLKLPVTAPDSSVSVIGLKVKGEAIVPPIVSNGMPAIASSALNKDHSADKAFDDDGKTYWASAAADSSAWIQVTLKKAYPVSAVSLQESSDKNTNIKSFQLQYMKDDEWITFCEGKKIGRGILKSFSPVTAQRFRLLITSTTPGIKLQEMMLYTD